MRFRQRGVTFIGWLFLLAPLVVVGYAGVRLAPVYLNYMKVVRALNLVASDAAGNADPRAIRTTIDKHFEIDMVDYPTSKDIKVTKSAAGGWDVEASYDDEAPLFANISLHVVFDKIVHAGSGSGP
jgi:ribosomal protein L11